MKTADLVDVIRRRRLTMLERYGAFGVNKPQTNAGEMIATPWVIDSKTGIKTRYAFAAGTTFEAAE